MNEIVKVNNQDVAVIEWKGERVITTAQLADVYEATTTQIKQNYNNNEKRFEKNNHYYLLQGEELRELKSKVENFDLVKSNVNQLYLWTRRGASRHCKMLGTDKAWEQFDYLEEAYFNPQPGINTEELSPELQMFGKMFELVAKQELKQKEQQAELDRLDNKIDSIKEVVALNPNDWRKDTSRIISKIALNQGGYEHIKQVREESYRLLEQRMGVALNIRLTNKKKTMSLNGVCKSKIDKLNQLDVIADDKKLIEGYISIIKDMAIKYGIVDIEVA